MALPTLPEQLESYMTRVVNSGAGATQRRETRLAFYAGVVSTLKIIAAVSALPDSEDEAAEAALARMHEDAFKAIAVLLAEAREAPDQDPT